MKNTRSNEQAMRQLPEEEQLERIRRVIAQELTDRQRQTLVEYYFRRRSVCHIARDRGVHKSTVLRTLRRAENKLRRFLAY